MSAPARVIWNDGRRASCAVEAQRDLVGSAAISVEQLAHLGRSRAVVERWRPARWAAVMRSR
jgi:hypothetical protein